MSRRLWRRCPCVLSELSQPHFTLESSSPREPSLSCTTEWSDPRAVVSGNRDPNSTLTIYQLCDSGQANFAFLSVRWAQYFISQLWELNEMMQGAWQLELAIILELKTKARFLTLTHPQGSVCVWIPRPAHSPPIFWPRSMSHGILAPTLGTKLAPPALEARSPNHWTARRVPCVLF